MTPEAKMPTNTDDFALARFLPYRLTLASERISAGLAKRYREEFGISPAEWRVLTQLADASELSVRDLEQRIHLEKSKASRAATRLAAEGYVTKTENSEDRRLIKLSLSAKGQELMARLTPLAAEFQQQLETLLADEFEILDSALEKMIAKDL
jgi:DNA-binding MarR family transcriptional regulator